MTQENKNPVLRQALSVAAVLVVALLVRVQTAERSPVIATDGTIFLQMARQFTTDSPAKVACDYQYHPAYPAVIAVLASVLKPSWPDGWITLARTVSIASGLLMLTMVYLFARKTFDHATGLMSTLLLGLSMVFTQVGGDVLSDSMALALAMAAFVLGLKAQEDIAAGRWRALPLAALSGIAAGAGYLTRPEEILPAIIVAAVFILTPCPQRKTRIIQLLALAALAVSTAACVAPYAATIGAFTAKKSMADFTFAGSAPMMLAQISPLGDLIKAFARVFDRARAAVGTPITILIITSLVTYVGRYVLRMKLPASVLITPKHWPAVMMAGTGAIMFFLLTALEYHHPRGVSARHAMLMVILLTPLAGAAILILAEWVVLAAGKLKPRLTRAAFTGGKISQAAAVTAIRLFKGRPQLAVCLWLAAALASQLPHVITPQHADKGCYRQAGLFIRTTYGPGRFVLASEGWAPFYADSPACQFTSRASNLRDEDFTSTTHILARMIGGPIKYDFLVLDEDEAIIRQVFADPRFEFIKTWQSGSQQAWLFRARSPWNN